MTESREAQTLVWRHPGGAVVTESGAEVAVGYRTVRQGSRVLEAPVCREGVAFAAKADERTSSGEATVTSAGIELCDVREVHRRPSEHKMTDASDTVWIRSSDSLDPRTERQNGAGCHQIKNDEVKSPKPVQPGVQQLSVSFLEIVPSIPEETQPDLSADLTKEPPVSGPSDADSSAVSEDSQKTAEAAETDTIAAAPSEPSERPAGTLTASNHVTFCTPGSGRKAARPLPPLRQSSLLSGTRLRRPAAERDNSVPRPAVGQIGTATTQSSGGTGSDWPRPCEAPLLAGVGTSSLSLRGVRQRPGVPVEQALSVVPRPVAAVAGPLSASSSGDSGVCSVSAQRLVLQTRPVVTTAAGAGAARRSGRSCDCDCADCGGPRTPPASPPAPVTVPAVLVLALAASYLCIGAAALAWWEDWRFQDGIFFCCVTLLTIGFGGRPPGALAPHPEPLLLFCCVYLTLGLAVVAMCFSLVQHQLVARCRRLGGCLRLTVERQQQRGRHRRGV